MLARGVTYCFAAPGVAPVSSVAVPCAAELCVACGYGNTLAALVEGAHCRRRSALSPAHRSVCAVFTDPTARSRTSARQMPWSEYGFLKRSEKRPFPCRFDRPDRCDREETR